MSIERRRVPKYYDDLADANTGLFHRKISNTLAADHLDSAQKASLGLMALTSVQRAGFSAQCDFEAFDDDEAQNSLQLKPITVEGLFHLQELAVREVLYSLERAAKALIDAEHTS